MRIKQTHRRRICRLLIIFFILFLTVNTVYAQDVSFSWLANPEPVTGYKLYYETGGDSLPPYNGTGLNEGTSPILIGKVTDFTVTGIQPGTTYHFVLTAYSDGLESDYTSVTTIQATASSTPQILNIFITQ